MLRWAIAAIFMVILIVYVLIVVIQLNRKKNEVKVKDVLSELTDGEETQTASVHTTSLEQFIIDKFHLKVSSTRVFVWTLRVIFIAIGCISFFIFGFAGLCLCLAVFIYSVMDTQLKNQIEETGVNRIGDTVSFINAFTPQIASGKSAKQAFLTYIQTLPVDSKTRILLEEYAQARATNNAQYTVPAHISEITTIYENAIYNEEKGVNDYLYIIEEAKDDLFQKNMYYSEYKTRCKEVLRPIEISYYVGIPIIFIALFGTFSGFWFTFWGAVAALLVLLLFFLFKFTINRLNINTLHKIM